MKKATLPDDVAYKEHKFLEIFEKRMIKVIRETDSDTITRVLRYFSTLDFR